MIYVLSSIKYYSVLTYSFLYICKDTAYNNRFPENYPQYNNQIIEISVEPNNKLFILSLCGNRITSLLLEGSFDNLNISTLCNNPIQLKSINDLSVVKIKIKYPSIGILSISTVDDTISEQIILEAEEN